VAINALVFMHDSDMGQIITGTEFAEINHAIDRTGFYFRGFLTESPRVPTGSLVTSNATSKLHRPLPS